MNHPRHAELANHAWSVADLLRGDYKQADYGKVILPFTMLRRMECVLEPTRDTVREAAARFAGQDIDASSFLRRAAGQTFYNTSSYTLRAIADDAAHAAKHLTAYVGAFSPNAREVLERYEFAQHVKRLDAANLLYLVIGRFADLDLRLTSIDDHQMGYVFEDLIRRFAEQSNETAGEHFTPREVIDLMVYLVTDGEHDTLTKPGIVRRVYDPACGTGGMLTAAENHITRLNPGAQVTLFGQELNPESWAICRSDMMIKGHDSARIAFGNSFSHDGHAGEKFDYLLANPPFGVEWKKVKSHVEDEHVALGFDGRFGAGLPRINDGSLLFLQHMLAKMSPPPPRNSANGAGGRSGGARVAIVFNGSPLFTGSADSGESRIRRWILENDWLEGIVALPDQLFYNTGISTYLWILTNNKARERQGRVVLLDAREQFAKMRKSLGNKRKHLTDQHIREVTRAYGDALRVVDNPDDALHGKVKIFRNTDFGYRRITVERPLRLRFEITDDTLAAMSASKVLARHVDVPAFVEALRPLVGTTWPTRADAFDAVRIALRDAGLLLPVKQPFTAAMRDLLGTRSDDGEMQLKAGAPEPDAELRDYENVPLDEDVEEYLTREVLPHVPDAWIDHAKTKIGYEIPFTRHFYVYTPPRPLAEIDAELKRLEMQILKILEEVSQ